MAPRQRPEKTTWVPVPELGGFELKLKYVSRRDLNKMVADATESGWDSRRNQPTEKINPARLLREYAAAIVDWRGLTREIYGRMIPIIPEEYPEEIPCTEEFKLELLEEAYGFDAVVRQLTQDLRVFEEERQAAETKNL
jgi:hypothetical protein